MKFVLLAILMLVALGCGKAVADESWQDALGRMPLGGRITELSRTNAIPLMLNAFQSNGVVKAFIFMPGAADDFVFFRRAHAALTNSNPTLADAIIALTNQTHIRAEFRAPFLLLYTTQDSLDPIITIKSKSTAAKLQSRVVTERIELCDCNWDFVRPQLQSKLSVGLRPFPNDPSTWHFWPQNFAACGVTQWELLEAIALSGKTTLTLHWLTAHYILDTRNGPVENLESFPGH
jgi:hypothetical protein